MSLDRLVARLDRVDPEAGRLVRAGVLLDRLAAETDDVPGLLLGLAELAGAPLVLVPERGGSALRANGEIVEVRDDQVCQEAPRVELAPGQGHLVMIADLPLSLAQAMILERGAALLADRRRPGPGGGEDPVAHDPLGRAVDSMTPRKARDAALGRLGLRADDVVTVYAVRGPRPSLTPPRSGERAGISRPRPAHQLPESWHEARLCLRLTAGGGDEDPGPRQLSAEDAGALVLLARSASNLDARVEDLTALHRAAGGTTWAMRTLHAVAETTTLRGAAEAVPLHHSTLQRQVRQLERTLGWSLTSADGRLRLQLALALRRLQRNVLTADHW